jgi:hypothetical protein
MTRKQIEELVKVREGKPYTKNSNFWSSLSKASIVDVLFDNDKVVEVRLRPWGRFLLQAELDRETIKGKP